MSTVFRLLNPDNGIATVVLLKEAVHTCCSTHVVPLSTEVLRVIVLDPLLEAAPLRVTYRVAALATTEENEPRANWSVPDGLIYVAAADAEP